jgi:hypothetical protein
MSEDYIEKSRRYAAKITGGTDEEIDANLPAHFAKYGPVRRSQILQEIEATAPSEIGFEEAEMRKAANRSELVGRLNDIHERLRRIGR